MHNDKSQIRAVAGGSVRQERSTLTPLNEPPATIELTVNAPVVDPWQSEPTGSRVPQTQTQTARDAIAQSDASTQTVELKYPAPRNSLKQRFDEIKINFLARHAHESVKSILFVGASRGDGASTAAYNFAKTLAEDLDVRVLFINADLRAPAPGSQQAPASQSPGLTSLASAEMRSLLPASQGNFQVLPSGRNYADPAVLFQSKRFEAFLQQVSQQFDYIVLDGPPLDEAPESIALSSKVDGVMLVIDAQNTRRKIALRAKKRIQDVGGKILGVVLNRRKFYVPNWLYKRI